MRAGYGLQTRIIDACVIEASVVRLYSSALGAIKDDATFTGGGTFADSAAASVLTGVAFDTAVVGTFKNTSALVMPSITTTLSLGGFAVTGTGTTAEELVAFWNFPEPVSIRLGDHFEFDAGDISFSLL